MASFLAIGIPILAIVLLMLVLRRDPKRDHSSIPTLPKSELSRQVWKATRPPRAARRAAAPKPKFAPLTPPAKVAPFRPPRPRDQRGA